MEKLSRRCRLKTIFATVFRNCQSNPSNHLAKNIKLPDTNFETNNLARIMRNKCKYKNSFFSELFCIRTIWRELLRVIISFDMMFHHIGLAFAHAKIDKRDSQLHLTYTFTLQTHANTHTCTHTHTNIHTHTRTHTRKHSCFGQKNKEG